MPGKVETVRYDQHLPGNSTHLKWRKELPSLLVNLGELGRNVKKLVADYGGSIPLASLLHCYALQFPPLLALPGEEGVHLEHLLQAIKYVAIPTTGVYNIKRLADASTGLKDVFKVGKLHLLLTFTLPILTEAFQKQGKERN